MQQLEAKLHELFGKDPKIQGLTAKVHVDELNMDDFHNLYKIGMIYNTKNIVAKRSGTGITILFTLKS